MLIFVIITNVIINTIWLLTHLLYVWFVSKFQLFGWESSLVTVVLSETVASEPGWLLYNKKKAYSTHSDLLIFSATYWIHLYNLLSMGSVDFYFFIRN